MYYYFFHIMRDLETGNSRDFGFISYYSFDASDAAIEAMNGQYLCNRQITTSYAYKKDTKGERHEIPAGKNLCLRKMKLRTLGNGYLSLIKIVELCFTYAITIWIC